MLKKIYETTVEDILNSEEQNYKNQNYQKALSIIQAMVTKVKELAIPENQYSYCLNEAWEKVKKQIKIEVLETIIKV